MRVILLFPKYFPKNVQTISTKVDDFFGRFADLRAHTGGGPQKAAEGGDLGLNQWA